MAHLADKDTIVFGADQGIYATVLHLDSLIRGAPMKQRAALRVRKAFEQWR
jgi:hypothetical protein